MVTTATVVLPAVPVRPPPVVLPQSSIVGGPGPRPARVHRSGHRRVPSTGVRCSPDTRARAGRYHKPPNPRPQTSDPTQVGTCGRGREPLTEDGRASATRIGRTGEGR